LHEIIFKHKEVFRVTSAYLVFFFTMFSTQLSRDPARNIKKKKKKRDLEKKKKKKDHQKVPLPRRNTPFYVCRQASDGRWRVLARPRSQDAQIDEPICDSNLVMELDPILCDKSLEN
jgi:hypothetical protein